METFAKPKALTNDRQSHDDASNHNTPDLLQAFMEQANHAGSSAYMALDTATKFLGDLTIVYDEPSKSLTTSKDAVFTRPGAQNLNDASGWHSYGRQSDSVSQSADGSVQLKLGKESASKTPDETGFCRKIDLGGDVSGEQAVHIEFWARSTAEAKNQKPLTVALIATKYPFAQTTNETVDVNSKWEKHAFNGIASIGKDGLTLHFKPASDVELKQISVTPESLQQAGVKPEDLTQDGMEKNVDKYRKTGLQITVLDADGKPVSDAQIKIEQKKQQFLFGVEVQQLAPNDSSAEQLRYQKAFTDTFNFATITPYWKQTETMVPGSFHDKDNAATTIDYSQFDAAIKFMSAPSVDVPVKLTPAFWPHFTPSFAGDNPAAAQKLVDANTKRFVEHFSQFANVKVIENNEVAAALNDYSENGVTKWVQQDAAKRKDDGANVVEQETQIEKGVLDQQPKNRMQIMYNDYIENGQEFKLLDKLQKDGKLPDQIGIQMHMTQEEWPLARVQKIVNDLAKYSRPIYISEISVLSGEHGIGKEGIKPDDVKWPSTEEGKQRQADYLEKLYTTLYSNPNVYGITYWDLTDKNGWQGAPRGLLNKDNTHKPAYDRLHHLIKEEWNTNESCQSNDEGSCDKRVFVGDYDITVTNSKSQTTIKRVRIDKNAQDQTEVTIQLP